jgi:hypothetical protein
MLERSQSTLIISIDAQFFSVFYSAEHTWMASVSCLTYESKLWKVEAYNGKQRTSEPDSVLLP